jgi:hypothetical protein
MSGSSAGFTRPGLTCVNCGHAFPLFLSVENFGSVESLSDPFQAKCPDCDHEGTYPKSAIGILASVGNG